MLVLNRLCSNLFGTYGVLIHDRKVLCYTLELPWLGNVQNQSCIPLVTYPVFKTETERFGPCFHVQDVPGRSGILIHAGNTIHDTRGCILPGLDVSENGVSHSRAALNRLLAKLPMVSTLDVREV